MAAKTYTPRLMDSVIARKLTASGGLLLRGPRACGKTTTALHHAQSSVRLDVSDAVRQMAEASPATLLAGEAPRLLDEWQLVPSLWNAVRAEIDARAAPGQFILTGSAAPDEDATRHTGAGRIARVRLRPMSLLESGEASGAVKLDALFGSAAPAAVAALGGPTVERYAETIIRGGWPALVRLPAQDAQEALFDYVDNIAAVDLRALASPPDPLRMAALIRALARNVSTEASLAKLAAESGLGEAAPATQTVRKYLDQLARCFVLEELPAWNVTLRSSIRLRVKPKWHFVDPSLAAAALGAGVDALLRDPETLGLFFESLAVRDLRIYAEILGARVFHYRDSTDLEIDAIVERRDGRWLAVEVKLGGETAIAAAVAAFDKLKKRLPDEKLAQLVGCCVLTAGEASFTRPDGVHVVALGHLGVTPPAAPAGGGARR